VRARLARLQKEPARTRSFKTQQRTRKQRRGRRNSRRVE